MNDHAPAHKVKRSYDVNSKYEWEPMEQHFLVDRNRKGFWKFVGLIGSPYEGYIYS